MRALFCLFICCFLLLGACRTIDKPEEQSPSATSNMPAPSATPKEVLPFAQDETPLLDKSENRIYNLCLAAQSIQGLILSSGEIFSFNETVGKRSQETGYRKAPSIVDGEKQMEYGGGVCQLATTLLRVAKKSNLTVLERHGHKKEVAYAEPGTDAAVSYGLLDMKFQNTLPHAIRIQVEIAENCVRAEIFPV